MKFVDFKIEENEIITQNKFLDYVRKNSNLKYLKLDFIKKYHLNSKNIDNILNKEQYIISFYSDVAFDKRFFKILHKFPNIKLWFTINKFIWNNKIITLPMGLPDILQINKKISYRYNRPKILNEVLNKKKEIKNLCFINFSANTYKSERCVILNNYKNKEWVTYNLTNKTENGYKKYLENIHSHKFVFAPRGNGINTYRLWESLYLRTIPIVKYHVNYEGYKKLPILFVNNWHNITEDFLNKKYDEIMSKEYNFEKLRISYWYNIFDKCIKDE